MATFQNRVLVWMAAGSPASGWWAGLTREQNRATLDPGGSGGKWCRSHLTSQEAVERKRVSLCTSTEVFWQNIKENRNCKSLSSKIPCRLFCRHWIWCCRVTKYTSVFTRQPVAGGDLGTCRTLKDPYSPLRHSQCWDSIIAVSCRKSHVKWLKSPSWFWL